MNKSVVWTCCRCNDSPIPSYIKICSECYHLWCQACDHEFHEEDIIFDGFSYDSSPEAIAKASSEDFLFESDKPDSLEVHDESIANQIENDDHYAFQEDHVSLNSINLNAAVIIHSEATESDCSSPSSKDKTGIDEKHERDEVLSIEGDVERRKEVIQCQFEQIQAQNSKLAEAKGCQKQQKTRSSYFEQLKDPTCFAFAWERCVLLLWSEFATAWLGSKYTINVVQKSKSGGRIILFMSGKELTRKQQNGLRKRVLDMLPLQFHATTFFQFSTGSVERLVGYIGTSETDEDRCDPRNPYYYSKPAMGDSVGWPEDPELSAATLGPCLKITDKGYPKWYWLVNHHLFQSAFQEKSWPDKDINILHPAPADQRQCNQNEEWTHHSTNLGIIKAVSGRDWKTTRIARVSDALEERGQKGPHHVVVDWALAAVETGISNLPRSSNSIAGEDCQHVTTISDTVLPNAPIFSNGRSSGFQEGQISSCPAVVSGGINGTGITTREWTVHRRCPENSSLEDDSDWISSGIGVSGDSGACIIDSENNELYGQVWGRNIYHGKGARITYFTDINDIVNDIKEKYPDFTSIELPKCDRDEESAHPACQNCHERQILEAKGQLQSVKMGQQSNSDLDLLAHPQDTDTDGSLTAKFGSPSGTFGTDLDFTEEDLLLFGRDIQREHSFPQSLTNSTDMSQLASPPNMMSSHPGIRQDWLGLLGIGSNDPFFGALPMNLDDSDVLERPESELSIGYKDKMQDTKKASKGLEGKRSFANDYVREVSKEADGKRGSTNDDDVFTYDYDSGLIKRVRRQKTP